MKKIFSLLAIMLIALVATQAICAAPTQKRLASKTIEGVMVAVDEFANKKPGSCEVLIIAKNNNTYPVAVVTRVSLEGGKSKFTSRETRLKPG